MHSCECGACRVSSVHKVFKFQDLKQQYFKCVLTLKNGFVINS